MQTSQFKKKTLFSLFIPLFIDLFLMMVVGFADTFMLAFVSDNAVAAVGVSNSLINMLIYTINFVASGVTAVMTQYLGAKKSEIAYKSVKISALINGGIGVLIALVLVFFAKPLLVLMNIDANLMEDGKIYTMIAGGSCLFLAVSVIYSSSLRAYGHAKLPTISNVIANIINVVLNTIFIFGLLGAPKLGVMGVAIATAVARFVGLLINFIGFRLTIKKEPKAEISSLKLLKKILSIGIPSALENILYSVSVGIVVAMVNLIGITEITTRTYIVGLSMFSSVFTMAIANATTIVAGWKIGEGDVDGAYKLGFKSSIIGAIVSLIVSSSIFLFSDFILGIFTNDLAILALGKKVLFIDIFLCAGKNFNICLNNLLKATGDGIFTVIAAVLSMFLVSVLGARVLGFTFALGFVGVHIAAAFDEIVRGICMIMRWKSKKWSKRSLIAEKRKD